MPALGLPTTPSSTPHLVQLQRVLEDGLLAGTARIQPLPQSRLAGCLSLRGCCSSGLLLLQLLRWRGGMLSAT